MTTGELKLDMKKHVAKSWWQGRRFKHPETGHMVMFKSLPLPTQKELNQQFKTTTQQQKDKQKSLPFDDKDEDAKSVVELLGIRPNQSIKDIGHNQKLIKGLTNLLQKYKYGNYSGFAVVNKGNALAAFGERGVMYLKNEDGKLKPFQHHSIELGVKDNWLRPIIRKVTGKSTSQGKYIGYFHHPKKNRLHLFYEKGSETFDIGKDKTVSVYTIFRPQKPRKTVQEHIKSPKLVRDIISFLDARTTGEAVLGKAIRDKLKKELGSKFGMILLHFGDPDNPADGDVRLKWLQHLERLRK